MSDAELVVLGTAQDGGLPHAGCLCRQCYAARLDPLRRRLPASLGVVSDSGALLVDATLAFAEQIYRLWQARPLKAEPGERFAPPETVVLTHAHTGHYAGLWQLDRSVMAARGVRVLGSAAMIAFLKANEPWAMMEREGFITLTSLPLETAVELLPGIRLTLLPVPHRSEWGVDTVALHLRGPRSCVLYLPDIDSWDAWDRDIASEAGAVDLALLDGCFWEPFHIPGVPHPPIRQSMERLAEVAGSGKTRIAFTHLNHSNPVCDPTTPEAREVAARGFHVAQEEERFPL
ncbi:MAG: hypothetical protein DCC58_17070 [Chloroflexi bacterium]|nr:MAG: hypothetical protein DCC58_17070 [Chloroflexota bacterium]